MAQATLCRALRFCAWGDGKMGKKFLLFFSLLWYHLTNGVMGLAADVGHPENDVSAERRAVGFIGERLTEEHGLIRNAIEFDRPSDAALSESMGQVMLYAAKRDDTPLWNLYRGQTEKYFWKDGFYAWRIRLNEFTADEVSALVDDLRLAKAYIAREEKHGGECYEKIAEISRGLLEKSVDAEGNIGDFYDAKAGVADHVSLFYLDTNTMGRLAAWDERWRKVKGRAEEILRRMPENELGFFPKSYYFEGNRYRNEEEISMVENIYTAVFAEESGRNTKKFAAFLRRELQKGMIANRYFADGRPSFNHDSVAVYALAARYFGRLGDKENALAAYKKMTGFYIAGGKLAGGFGYNLLGTVYAFDQLEALITMAGM